MPLELEPLVESSETLTPLEEDVQEDYALLPGFFPGPTAYPGDYHIGLRLEELEED